MYKLSSTDISQENKFTWVVQHLLNYKAAFHKG